jgi:choline dehydrogenase-like flavoprotein
MTGFDYDVLIIGSGLGGSVAAKRAAENGYRSGVMESGRRWPDQDIPKTQWDLPGFLWFPAPSCTGSSGSSTSTTCSCCEARASVAARTSTPTRCMSRRGSSSSNRATGRRRIGKALGPCSCFTVNRRSDPLPRRP